MDPALSPEPASSAVRLDASWRTPLAGEFAQPYMQALKDFLVAEKAAGKPWGGSAQPNAPTQANWPTINRPVSAKDATPTTMLRVML